MNNLGLVAISLLIVIVTAACGASVFSLDVGDCFNDPNFTTEGVEEVKTIPCSESHDNEVYAVTDYPASNGSYPGFSAIESFSTEYCLGAFAGYVGIPYQDSRLDITYYYPTPDGWRDANDREIACYLFDLNFERLTRSMKDSRE